MKLLDDDVVAFIPDRKLFSTQCCRGKRGNIVSKDLYGGLSESGNTDKLEARLSFKLSSSWSDSVVSTSGVSSGRTDWFLVPHVEFIPGDGTVEFCFPSTKDIGRYVAKIIIVPRTLNRKVFAYTDVMTYSDIADLVDEASGEKCIRKQVSLFDLAQPCPITLTMGVAFDANKMKANTWCQL